ncbi:MAG TPA: alkaline phosphatase family protein [Polyangiales bacterium]|nr:alkaline phosphatase family protein [Polyangiales bacterium]
MPSTFGSPAADVLLAAPMPRLLMIGLDCAAPKLVFERYRPWLPNLAGLMERGTWGALRSTEPPITVPAWACMLSGYDPGELGLYGFRQRVRGSYELRLADASDLALPMVWDRLGAAGRRSCALFVPPSYPPRPLQGYAVSCFLTPDASHAHTYPLGLAEELTERFGSYEPDVDDYRTEDLAGLRSALYRQSAQRFDIAEHLLRTRKPDFLALVDIALDRFHHAFWHHFDPDDPRHDASGPYADEGLRFYRFLDRRIGQLLAAAPSDTSVLVASDHGARPLLGGICINEWLLERGYLVLHSRPSDVTPFSKLDVDWSRTRVWAEGGYYARLCCNVRGREPTGCVAEHELPALRAQLAAELALLPGPHGERLAHRILLPERAYRATRGLPPDLMVFFDDLGYRALGSVGHGSLYSAGNDTGPDGCNHDWDGVFVLAGPDITARGPQSDLSIYDVAQTILGVFDLSDPQLLGRDRSRN